MPEREARLPVLCFDNRNYYGLIIIIIIIIIIGKYTIPFMHSIYSYIPETNHVRKQCNVAAKKSTVLP
jgi:hypothetical protein